MRGLRRFGPLVLVAVLLVGAVIAAAMATPQITHVPLAHPPKPPAPRATDAPPPTLHTAGTAAGSAQGSAALPGWLVTLGSALCIALVLAIVGLLVWYLVRSSLSSRVSRLTVDENKAVPLEQQRDQVIAAVDAGLSGLTDEGDPRRAVIACWLRLEQTAAAAGTPRGPGDTPTDLVLRLLGAHRVSAAVLYRLADVYRRARYASHAVDTGMREAARSALAQLRAELTGRPPAGSVTGTPAPVGGPVSGAPVAGPAAAAPGAGPASAAPGSGPAAATTVEGPYGAG